MGTVFKRAEQVTGGAEGIVNDQREVVFAGEVSKF